MAHLFRLPLVLLPLAVMGCVDTFLPDHTLPWADGCGAAKLQDLVGRDAEVLQERRFGLPVRIIRPGTAVTMDHAPGRLNIALDPRDRITRISCG